MKMEFEFEQAALDVENEAVKEAAEQAERLIEIAVDKLFPHPDNPRHDLGDLTELTESIKSRGVLQNLTVVRHPFTDEEEYTVVIGHRRLEAAKRAGLATVPCRVTYMTERMQYTGKHSRLVKVFEFRDSGEVEVDGVTYAYTSHGDEFYLVFVDGDKKPALTYACKIYDYNE